MKQIIFPVDKESPNMLHQPFDEDAQITHEMNSVGAYYQNGELSFRGGVSQGIDVKYLPRLSCINPEEYLEQIDFESGEYGIEK